MTGNIELDAYLVLKRIKAAVEKDPCTLVGAFNLRNDVKRILAEAGL
jgi:hypothetical protein